MQPVIKYIEHKPAEHTDRAMAWIARVYPSSSGRTFYFNDMALKRWNSRDSNYYDMMTGELYWVSGVKKNESNRHWNGGGPIHIEESIVDWYHEYVGHQKVRELIVVPDYPKPDINQFHAIENEKMA